MTAADIITEVCRQHGISRAQLKGDRRVAHLVVARMAVAMRLRTERRLNFMQIARMLSRDHTTVHYWLKPAVRARKNAQARAAYRDKGTKSPQMGTKPETAAAAVT